ncbi:hypothetical protein ACLESD_25770 [Pyxidicoccus sp. 3LFB2]
MTPEQRARRMVGYLPPVLQGGTRLNLFFSTLAAELGRMETGLTRLMRSRWYTLARGFGVEDSLEGKGASELGRLGELYNLQPRRGEPDAYFRQHLAALVELHRTGLGSAPALLRLVSLVYLAQQPPQLLWEGATAVGHFTVRKADGTWRSLRIELDDNPPTAQAAQFRNVMPGQQLLTANGGLETAVPEISLTATEADIAVPILRHKESGLDLFFLGLVPKGGTLTLRNDRPPAIDGRPAKEPLILAHPTRFSSRDDVGPLTRFDAPGTRFSVFEENKRLPELVPGESHWSYDTLVRGEIRSYLLGWSEARLKEAEAQARVTRATPRADLRFDWTESTPATCVLRIPADYVPPHLMEPDAEGQVPGLPGLVRELAAALAYGRAAGVRTRIELTLPMPPEVVSVEEGPARQEVSLSFPETLEPKDALTDFGYTIQLSDQLPEPQEELAWDGVFGATRFNTSRFP